MTLRATAWVWMLVGCAAPDPVPLTVPTEGGVPEPPAGADLGAADTADARDTGDPPLGARCPDGTQPIPADAPQFCIDTFEASLSADGTQVASVPDAVPLVGVSFVDAQALCAATPAVLDGEVVGMRRLVRLTEWQDAADGVLGPGGASYPTGEDWPDDMCAVVDASGTPSGEELSRTGAHPDCVSAFGVFDQLGNAWEWVDPGLAIDVAEFVERQASVGRNFAVDRETGTVTADVEVDGLRLEVPGLSGSVGRDSTGLLVATDVTFQAEEPFDYDGYIVDLDDVSTEHSGFVLPVRVHRVDGEAAADIATLTVQVDQDGQPLTAKVGCAWYSGMPGGCTNSDWFFGHPPAFQGTISPRCAADPVGAP